MKSLRAERVALGLAAMLLGGVSWRVSAQASALPSVQVQSAGGDNGDVQAKGRELLDAMVAALGGEAWLHRQAWVFYGRAARFYEGQPDAGAPQFEEYHRANPFGERVVTISHYGAVIARDHADVVDVWTKDNGYEITYKGTTLLPGKEVADFKRRRAHSLEVVVQEWLKQPGVLVTYEGEEMVERRLAEKVSVVSASGVANTGDDAITLALDEGTHLPLSLSFQWRDPVYKDWNTDVEEFADYHAVQGIMTPFSITEMHNGDVNGERFLTKVVYGAILPAELFDPTRSLEKRAR